MSKRGFFNKVAKKMFESGYVDHNQEALFLTNPGISFDVLKGLAKKHNFTIGQTKDFEYISVPTSFKPYALDPDKLSLYDDFMKSYTYYSNNYAELMEAYQTLELMAENLSEINLILDTYTAEVLSLGFIDNPLKISISDSKAQSFVEKVFYRNKIYQKLPNIVRNLALYGNQGAVITYPYLEKWLTDDKVKDFNTVDVIEDLTISLVNPKLFKINTDEYNNPINYETSSVDKGHNAIQSTSVLNNKIWQPWQFTHMLIADTQTEPYGKSLLWSMRSAFDQLTTLEALLGISRASKLQRLVFYVPLPNGINMVDSYQFLNEFRTQYLNSIFSDTRSAKAGRKFPGAMSILTLPESHDGKKASFETIEANISLAEIDDVNYFLDKILRNSSLPKGYLIGDETITTAQALEAQDLKLKRTLIPLKQAVVNGIMNLVENVLAHGGYDVSRLQVDVSINAPIQVSNDTIEKYGNILEFVGGVMEMNPELPTVNKFQLLLKLGMPTDMATLICGKTSTNTMDTADEIAKFLKDQKIKPAGLQPVPPMEECVCHLSSKQYFKSNEVLKEALVELSEGIRIKDTVLLEKALMPTKVIHG